MKRFLSYLILAAVAAGGGWYAATNFPKANAPAPSSNGKKVLYYQSSMHPWIKADKPGKCTICGMDLVPVFEGDKGFETEPDVVALPRNSITVVGIQTTPVIRGNLIRTLRVTGSIEDDDTRHRYISAYVDGRIERLFVNYIGAEVQEGQPLATLYSPELLSAQKEYLIILNAKAPATSLENSRQRLKRLGLTDRQIAALPQKPEEWRSEILAPMSGTVVAREVYEGQYVKAGDRLFEIADFSKMWFLFDAYEQDIPLLRVGETVKVTTVAKPGKVYEAPITFIDPNFNTTTRATKVRVEIPNPIIDAGAAGIEQRELPHRVSAEGTVEARIDNVLVVPRSAILRTGASDIVFVDSGGGAYQLRKVKLGRRGDLAWEILEGVEEGELVVTQGNLLLDAQAQLQREARPELAADKKTAPDVIEVRANLGDIDADALKKLVTASNKASDALAADDYERFLKLSPELAQAASATPELAKLWQAVAAAGNMEKARANYQPFSTAVADLVLAHRSHIPELASVHVIECPMPILPGQAKWVQTNAGVRNPFYGSEMLTCGSEVK